jgi:hypothetical protein
MDGWILAFVSASGTVIFVPVIGCVVPGHREMRRSLPLSRQNKYVRSARREQKSESSFSEPCS